MKKQISIVLLCCVLLSLCGCNTKYKRISFDSQTLGDVLADNIREDTAVVNTVNASFPDQLPIYKISKHRISDLEFQQMEEQLGIADWYWNDFDGYKIYNRIAPYNDPTRGYFYTLNMTDDELEELAWETFNKIPFIEGTYEYVGITATMTEWTMKEGEYITEVTVTFRRLLDSIQIVGNDKCDLTFDASGLVELYITLFDYNKAGTMDVVPLKTAETRVKTPDSFSIDSSSGTVDTLQVDQVKLFWVNQHSDGCTILQPIYTFFGTASFDNGSEKEFRSRIIAIPESMTYEEE